MSYLSSSVGHAVEGQSGGIGADSGVCGVDLGGVDNGIVGPGGGGGCESENGDGRVLHLDGWYYLL